MQSYEGDHVRGEADGHAEEIFEKSASRSALSLQHRAKRAYEDQSQAHLSSTSAWGEESRRASMRSKLHCRMVLAVVVFIGAPLFCWSMLTGHIQEIYFLDLRAKLFASPFEQAIQKIVAECSKVHDTRTAPLTYLSDVLKLEGDRDEWGSPSPFLQPVSVVRKLVADGHIPLQDAGGTNKGSIGNGRYTWFFFFIGLASIFWEADVASVYHFST